MIAQTTVGLTLADDLFERASLVFTGYGPISNWHDVADVECNKLVRRFDALVTARTELAISGAMRWVWSQEAPIYDSQQWSI